MDIRILSGQVLNCPFAHIFDEEVVTFIDWVLELLEVWMLVSVRPVRTMDSG